MTRFFVRHPVSTWMIFTAFVVLGIYALPRLPIEAIPEVSLPTLTIQTPTERIILPASDIETTKLVPVSMMPEGLLDGLKPNEVVADAAFGTGANVRACANLGVSILTKLPKPSSKGCLGKREFDIERFPITTTARPGYF